MINIFFDSWESIVRTFTITVLGYIGIVVLLRITGKRTLAKMNAFDFIVTVALGSCLASVSLNKNVALIDGILVFALLIFLQYIITWLSVRFNFIKKIVTSTPVLLMYKGELLQNNLKQERIAYEEILVAARGKGISNIQEIDSIVLETTGDINFLKDSTIKKIDTLKDVKINS